MADNYLTIPIAKGSAEISLLGQMASRHGLIAGATGTGKTVTLQVLAEGFSNLGVPIFMADIKGDLSGLSLPGTMSSKLEERVKHYQLQEPTFAPNPVTFWDVFGVKGHPIRTTISEMGPLLLAKLLGLNETQAGVLNIVFRVADKEGLLLLDLKDLQAAVRHIGEEAKELTLQYGNVSAASVGAIQRAILSLEQQGAASLFGEPALNLADLMQTDAHGKGVMNILAADDLINSPNVYSAFLLWLLSELFEELPEVGDLNKPKMVLFFDEAHLLFNDASDVLLGKVEQLVRLIRSKGVGVYFVSQSPNDIPETVLAQLGNRCQHALRAFTPKDQKLIKAAAETFRENPELNTVEAISELAVGEALVSVLDHRGVPTPVERCIVLPPRSQIGIISSSDRERLINTSLVFGVYEKVVDRESAYEKLSKRAEDKSLESSPTDEDDSSIENGATSRTESQNSTEAQKSRPGGNREDVYTAFFKSTVRSVGSSLGRQIVRGLMGSILGRSRS